MRKGKKKGQKGNTTLFPSPKKELLEKKKNTPFLSQHHLIKLLHFSSSQKNPTSKKKNPFERRKNLEPIQTYVLSSPNFKKKN